MKKFVEYEKLSKRQKKEIDKAKRTTWGDVIPVTKRIESAKLYNRKRHQRRDWEGGAGVFLSIEV